MHIKQLFLPFVILFFILDFFSIKQICADEPPPVIINRSVEVQEIDGKKYHFHAVLQGQTLYSIARAYDVTIDEIISENPELEHGLRYDQLIKIPYVETPIKTEVEKDYIEHTVKRRETLFSISKQYDVEVKKILELNPDARRGLQVNQVLKIPREIEKEIAPHKEYEVVAGDTYFSLSRRFNISINEIKELNPELNDVLKAGQVIKLPQHVHLEPEKIDYEPEKEEVVHEKDLWDTEYCQAPKLKEQYNVALLIPLFLEDIEEYYEDGEELPENHKSFTFIEFYEGILIALDSVKKMGANIELHVFDVCQDIDKAKKVVNDPLFSEMDLVIGSFFPNTLELVTNHAKKNDVAVVSPLLPNLSQLNFYSNLFQITPSLKTQLNDLAEYVSYRYPDQNIIIVHDNQPNVAQIIREFNQNINGQVSRNRYFHDSLNLARVNGYYYDQSLVGERTTNVYVFNDSLLQNFPPPATKQPQYEKDERLSKYAQQNHVKEIILYRDSMQGLADAMSEINDNILVSLLGGEPVVTNYLRELTIMADTFDLKVFGVPQWINYQNLEIDHLQVTNAHIISPDFIDYSERHIHDFVLKYRERVKDEPGLYAFKGAEVGFYFMNALMTYGKDFHKCIYQINKQSSGNNTFKFKKPSGIENGWENQYAPLFRYKNYRLIDVRKISLADR